MRSSSELNVSYIRRLLKGYDSDEENDDDMQ